jgi:hypothetical protein
MSTEDTIRLAEAHRFMDTVTKMRNAQKMYFRTREKTYLEESKRLEREVDRLIESANKPLDIPADN